MIDTPLNLPCGQIIPNRICKAAMTEGLADARGIPTPELFHLYRVWSEGGAGLILSGNIQIDGFHLERPGNVILDGEPNELMRSALRSWAQAGTHSGNQFWAQISHAGRQCQKVVNPHPKAPSPIKLNLPGGQFGEPEAMDNNDIKNVINGFRNCSKAVCAAGFTGVQLHAAHGYLLSQFLSPRSNQRTDEWGGCLENRARLLLECVRVVRDCLGPSVPISVKLNSADFQRGAFNFSESVQVAKWLEEAKIDLLEISGGTYEQPRLLNLAGIEPIDHQGVSTTSHAREAYFADFAEIMRREVSIPLMVTGGIRRRDAMLDILGTGCADMVGIGRPLCVDPHAPLDLMSGMTELARFEDALSLLPKSIEFLNRLKLLRTISGFATQYWFYEQIARIGRADEPDPNLGVMTAVIAQTRSAKAWLSDRKMILNQ